MSDTTEPGTGGGKLLVVGLLIAAVIGVIVLKEHRKPAPRGDADIGTAVKPAEAGQGRDDGTPSASTEKLPKMIDLGADKCVPCKMMEPILEELRTEYAGRMKIVFIDVWENKEAGEEYGIRMIPTQIFYNAEGEELFRHEGFYSKEDILKKWKELGIDLDKEGDAKPKAETTSFLPSLPGSSGCGT